MDIVGEECEVYCEDGRRRVGGVVWIWSAKSARWGKRWL